MKIYIKESATGQKITSPEKVFNSLKKIHKADQEGFWLLGYNAQNQEIFRECIFLGGINHIQIDLKIIFRRLLQCGAFSFIVCHNHPAGTLSFSDEDIEISRRIKHAADILDFKMLDHLVIGESSPNVPGFVSFHAEGLSWRD